MQNLQPVHSQQADDVALPYIRPEEEIKQVPFRNLDEVGPAGSINSNVEDMIRYVRFHLNKGKHGDTQLLSASNAEQMQTPQVVIPGVIRYDDLGHESYGLGFVVITYWGHKLVAHGGSIDGFISLLAFMPRQNIGTILLTNFSGNNPVRGIVTGNVYDRLLGLELVAWVGRTKEEEAKEKKAHEAMKQEGYTPPRKAGTSHSHPLPDYAGTSQHPAYSAVTIAVDGTDLKATHNQKTVPLKHWHYDIFEAPEWQGAKVTFFYNNQGDIDRLAVPPERVQRGIQARRRRCRHRHGRLPVQRHLHGRKEIGLLGRGVIGARRWGLARTTTVQRSACEMV